MEKSGDGFELSGYEEGLESNLGRFDSPAGGLVTARGTGDGLVVRLDGRVERGSLRAALTDFISARKRFLAGNDILIEWVGALPEETFVQDISDSLARDFNITVRSSILREPTRAERTLEETDLAGDHSFAGSGGLAGGLRGTIDVAGRGVDAAVREGLAPQKRYREGEGQSVGGQPSTLFGGLGSDARARVERFGGEHLWDDPDARMVYATLRSGQRIESEHSVVVFGDVNSGGEIVAGGDIVVLGTLRGVAHAGAYDEAGGGRTIFAISMQPTQLRIGMMISRGSSDGQRGPELARIEGDMIVVEPYQSRNFFVKR